MTLKAPTENFKKLSWDNSISPIGTKIVPFLTANSREVLLWSLFSFSHFINFLNEIRKLKNLILEKKTENSYLGSENRKVLSWISFILHEEIKSLILHEKTNVYNVCPISEQCPLCLPNVPNFCPMSQMSAQWSWFLPNVICSQISDFFWYVLRRLLFRATSKF